MSEPTPLSTPLDIGPYYCRVVLVNASLMLWVDICNHQQGLPSCNPDLYDPTTSAGDNLLRYCQAILNHHKHASLADFYVFCENIRAICGLDLEYRTTQILHHSADFKENLYPYLRAAWPTYRRKMPYVPFPDSPLHSS